MDHYATVCRSSALYTITRLHLSDFAGRRESVKSSIQPFKSTAVEGRSHGGRRPFRSRGKVAKATQSDIFCNRRVTNSKKEVDATIQLWLQVKIQGGSEFVLVVEHKVLWMMISCLIEGHTGHRSASPD
ncbi:uncharacterized [Tachysurus ichikawai]